jgi:hypothetical protein
VVAEKARLYTAKYSEQSTRRSGRREFCKRLTGLGFKVLEHSGPSWAPNVVAATFIRAREKYFLVWMPLHACAAIRTAGAAGDGRVKFFDPNYGQATFANTNKFEFFLATYLSDLKIMENYGMGGGGLGTGVGDPTFVYLLA